MSRAGRGGGKGDRSTGVAAWVGSLLSAVPQRVLMRNHPPTSHPHPLRTLPPPPPPPASLCNTHKLLLASAARALPPKSASRQARSLNTPSPPPCRSLNTPPTTPHFLQVMFAYGANKRVPHPLRYLLTSASVPPPPGPDTTRPPQLHSEPPSHSEPPQRVMDRLSKMSGFSRWRLDRREGHYLTELAAERQQGKVVYLTSESEEVLQVDETPRNPLSLTCARRVTFLEGPLPTHPPVACVPALGTNPLTLKELGLAMLSHPLCPPVPKERTPPCSSPHPQPTGARSDVLLRHRRPCRPQ